MSTKSTIWLTEDDEHFYDDCAEPIMRGGEFIGNAVIMQISKKNVRVLVNDDDDLIIEFTNPDSEIYKRMMKTELGD